MQRRGVRVGAVALAAVVVSALGIGAAWAGTDPVHDGGFERPQLAPGKEYRRFDAGRRAGEWKVTSGSVFITVAQPPFETPPVGSQIMNLRPANAPGEGEICQTLSGLTPGLAVQVRFLAAALLGSSTIDVTLDGAPVAHLALPDGGIPAVFTAYHLPMTPTNASPVLCLDGDANGDQGFPLVDAVRVRT